MKSIRTELAAKMGGAVLLMLLVGGGGLYLSLRGALVKQFDDVLVAKAGAVVLASEIDEGELEIDFDVLSFAGFGIGARGDYFEVFEEGGESVARSPSLGTESLRVPPVFDRKEEGFANLSLPEDVTGRSFWTTYEPLIDDEENADVVAPKLKILVASADSTLRRTLRTAALFIVVFGCCGFFLILSISGSVVRSGLRSLDKMSGEVERIDVSRLARRVPVHGIPLELRGMAAKVNELLARLEESFGREKRFSSNAAHELRTPLAELRTMTELGTRWPDEFTEEHGKEMLEVISELESLLGTLSLLARAESEAVPNREPLDLATFVNEQLDRVRPRVEERKLEIDHEVGTGAFQTDPVLFRAIFQNLLDNAVDYSPKGSEIRLVVSPAALVVENDAPSLEPEDLEHLFSRFWRKSKSRSDKGHSGLGLSVVRGGVEHLGGECRAKLIDGRLRIEVDW